MRSLRIDISIVDEDYTEDKERKVNVIAHRSFVISPFVAKISESKQIIHRCVDKIVDYISTAMGEE